MRWRSILAVTLLVPLMISLHSPSVVQLNAQEEVEPNEIESIMDDMTLEEKVGQLFIVHVYGETPTDPNYEEENLENDRGGENFKEVIENYHPGGVIYFNWADNIGMPVDTSQVNALSNGIQDIAMDEGSSIPMFVSTDQEGGIVARVTEPATTFPGNMAIGATGSSAYAEQSAEILGEEMKKLGINMNFAPTLDVNVNPDNPVIGVRSYSEDPDLVSDLGISQIQGFQSEDVISTAKHFPGHGDTDVDSHYGLPIIEKDMDTLLAEDLPPFKDAIEHGVDAIMPAHIVVPALDDSELPATFSEPILTDYLRGELGYDGLIVTDGLDMDGVDVIPEEEVPVEAFKAGVDMLLDPPDIDLAYNAMLDAVEDGEISEDRLDASVYRILDKKMEQDLFGDPYEDPEAVDQIGSDENLQLAEDMTDDSITLVKNDDDVLPLDYDTDLLVTGPESGKPDVLSDLLPETESYETSDSPTDAEIEEAVSLAENKDMVVVPTSSAHLEEEQQELVTAFQETGTSVVVAATGNPYDIAEFPDVEAYLTTYGDQDISIESLAKVLTGEINPEGELPVTIPEHYDFGHGLNYEIDTANIEQLVDRFEDRGDLENDEAVHALERHLTAVGHYENQEEAEKVIDHMEGFMDLLDQQLENEWISEEAYDTLMDRTDDVIAGWH
ncbi:glycoside hydrolase family 3 C-terminal domain-containing protein [Salicibibacter cibi]|uniref:beta-N-acetylhexosaminidase n=1 Tax=Salicibibacter cibi TaxID=2743001 RepID=A0A7T7CED2_9BACI|nr:glycoside hydrolase family 3 protein [Salicibibacter cibi]QQK78929.1 glycoside hydrolase family 3 C-terminal domain-containing protein [Salicibibacter cibi]